MFSLRTLLVLLALFILGVSCQRGLVHTGVVEPVVHDNTINNCFGEGNERAPGARNVGNVVESIEKFGTDFFVEVSRRNPEYNIVASPYSLWAVLSKAYLGSNRITRRQLGNSLGLGDAFDALNNFNVIATRLELIDGLRFRQLNQASFAKDIPIRDCMLRKLVDVKQVDFANTTAAAAQINTDVSKATFGLIEEFLQPDDLKNARFVLINAVYFKGTWTYQFDPTLTQLGEFKDFNGVPKGRVPMMRMDGQVKLHYRYSDFLQAEILELPYMGDTGKDPIGMVIILPQLGVKLDDVLEWLRLNPGSLNDEIAAMTTSKKRVVDVAIPKFKMTTRMAREVEQTLNTLGIVDVFDRRYADMSLFSDEPLYVQAALHHATIEVSEEGTVAAAASGLVGTRSGADAPVIFVANRPFIFLIRHNRWGLTLFSGVLRDISQLE